MPGRNVPLVSGEYYHLFNRGVEKREIFTQQRDYIRFIQTFFYYQFQGQKQSFSKFSKYKLTPFKPLSKSKLVEVVCYCLMPNHFHFLVRQIQDGGIAKFISQISNSYTKYFNTRYDRVGSLLQGTFKAVGLENDNQLLHLSRYIHINPVVSGLVDELDRYPWSSYHEYARRSSIICSAEEILAFFKLKDGYQKFLNDQINYGTTLEILKHKVIDEI